MANQSYPLKVIDFSKSNNDILLSFQDALQSNGIFGIIGHAITQELFIQLSNEMNLFFQSEMKHQHNRGVYGHPLGGYTPQGIEAVGLSNQQSTSTSNSSSQASMFDPLENFVYYGYPSLYQNQENQSPILHANEYYHEMERILFRLHQLLEISLHLPENHLNDFYFHKYNPNTIDVQHPSEGIRHSNMNALKFSHYFPTYQDHILPKGQDAIIQYAPHTDYLGFTILHPDRQDWDSSIGSQGLQVWCELTKEWKAINLQLYDSNILLVITGDIIPIWSNFQYKAPLHRVLGPLVNTEAFNSTRNSIIFFSGPHESTNIYPLVNIDDNTRTTFQTIQVGEYLQSKLKQTNKKLK